MIIGIDVRALANSHRSGVEEYAEQIISRMIRLAPDDTFKLFFSSYGHTLPSFDWMQLPNVEVHQFKIPNRLLFLMARLCDRPKIDLMVGGADVFFSPHFFLVPLSKKCRRVTTFHDLSFERFPEFFTLGRRWWHRFMGPARQSRLSDRIIAVSHSTKTDLVEYYQVDPAHIEVVYNGSSIQRPTSDQLSYFKEKYHLPDRYIFSLGTLEPRKNTVGLIRAFNLLKERPGFEDVKLLIGGSRGWKHQEVFLELEKSPHRKDIEYLGYISGDRGGYYALASVFVYPSFFEGFGIPVLEAIACGTPVITSANSALPEVVGTAAIFVDPYSISSIVAALETVLSQSEVAESLRAKSLERAGYFNWDKAARETLAVIHRG